MVGTVVELELEVYDGIAGHRSLVRGLEHAALDGRDVLARDHTADDLIHELHP